MIPKINFVFNPNIEHVNAIEQWLLDEQNDTGDSFYCNWNIIASAFSRKQMVVLTIDDRVVAYSVWCIGLANTATIDLINVRSDVRRAGFGKKLIQHLLEYFIGIGVIFLDVDCISDGSEVFARKLGFTDFPASLEIMYTGTDNKRLFKILVPCLAQSNSVTAKETIEIWENEPYCSKDTTATWTWELKFKENSRELTLPIIHPAYRDWRIRWKAGGDVVFDGKIKRFPNDIEVGKFAIIREVKSLSNL